MGVPRSLGAAIAAAALLVSPAALPAQAPPAGAGSWNVDWGDTECSLVRRSERAPYPTFELSTIPGTRYWTITVVGPDLPASARRLTISFQPGGAPVEGEAEVDRTPAGRGVIIYQLPDSFPDRVGGAQAVTVSRDGAPVIEIPLPRAREAVAAIRECVNNVLRDWGIDPAAFNGVATPAVADVTTVVGDSDYPIEAIDRHEEGTVVARLRVSETGEVTSCRAVVSSGSERLDLRTCSVIITRLRATPARDGQGRAVASQMVAQLRWALPD